MATNNAVNTGLSGQTGTGNFVGSTSPTIVTPVIAQIKDANGNIELNTTATASAVNYIQLINAATATSPIIAANGTDANPALVLIGKGTGGVLVQGITSGSSAPAGYSGELIKSVIAYNAGTNPSFTSATALNITSIALTAGNWIAFGNIAITGSTTNLTYAYMWLSLTSATLVDASLFGEESLAAASAVARAVPMQPFYLSSPQTLYLSAQCGFATGSARGCGALYAIRV